jgi:hypothetical protein
MNATRKILFSAILACTSVASVQASGLTAMTTVLGQTMITAEGDIRATAIRRRPGHPPPKQRQEPVIDPARVEPVSVKNIGDYKVPIMDRWRLVDALGLATQKWYEPYDQNTYKGDKPLHDDWFLNLLAVSDTVIEPRSIPTPLGPQATNNPGQLDQIGSKDQLIFNQNFIAGLVYYKGNTVFRPPDYEYRLTLVFNYNRVEVDETRFLNIDPRFDDTTREDSFVAVQEVFFDKHLRNVSDRFDFDSIRFGIQPFSSDFRGFLFQDNQLGVRLFGNRDNNKYQYNLAWFRRVEKDTNSGLNDIFEGLRDDDVFIANMYVQDWPRLGFFTQATVIHNRNREDELFFDENGFLARPASLGIERPHNYDVTYLGLNGDGHFGRVNLTASAYYAVGDYEPGTFVDQDTDISAGFLAAEASMDFNWVRVRLSGLYASGDEDPFDDEANGFDAIFENPVFAGADTSYWIRQTVPFIGGGGVTLSSRNSILNSMRSSRELGQSNFENPGMILLGVGADLDITPEQRISINVNQMWFDDTSVLEVARQQGDIDSDIGLDVSIAWIWRPKMTQNIVVRLSAAGLLPGDGFEDLYGDEDQYSILANIIFSF